jgi:hypothetical protein
MKPPRLPALLLVAIAFCPAAHADEAGERRIRDALSPFFGVTAFEIGALTVASEGSGYRLTFDPAPLLAHITLPNGSFSMTPLSMVIAERATGDWDVSGNDPIEFAIRGDVEGRRNEIRYAFAPSPYSAVWSPRLRAFTSSSGRIGAGAATVKDEISSTDIQLGDGFVRTATRDSGDGGVDAESVQSFKSVRETVRITPNADTQMAPINIAIGTGQADAYGRINGLRYSAMLDLWAFLVANAEQGGEQIKVKQEELRTLLRALGPIWRDMSGGASVSDLRIALDQGNATIDQASYTLAYDGVSASSDYTVGLSIEGLTATSPFIPAWASALVPRDLRFGIGVVDIDLATPAAIVIDGFDLSQQPALPEEAQQRIAAGFMANPIRVRLQSSRVAGQSYQVEADGEIEVRGQQAAMKATVIATGLDELIGSVQAAGVAEAYQVAGALSIAKGFGRGLPDGRMRWEIEADWNGQVKVNGAVLRPPRQ